MRVLLPPFSASSFASFREDTRDGVCVDFDNFFQWKETRNINPKT